MNNKKHIELLSWRLRRILILSLPFIVLLIIVLNDYYTYSVTAKTELIEFITEDVEWSKIPLDNVKVLNYNGNTIDTLSGAFKINKGSITKISRIGKGNVVIQIILSDTTSTSVGAFYSDKDEFIRDASNFVELHIDDIKNRVDMGETIIIPMSGTINLGRTVNYETFGSSTAIVRKGKVILLGKYFLSKDYFKSASFDLNIGDEFRVEEQIKNAYGFATINENSAMTVAYKVFGKKGKISIPGPVGKGSGYYLSGSLYSRFENDPLVKALSIVVFSLASLVTLWPIFKKGFFK